MADERFTILDLPSLLAAEVSDKTLVFVGVDDDQSVQPASKRMALSELETSIGGGGGGGGDPTNLITITAHGFTSADVGKPIGWRANGTVFVWDDAAAPQTEYPIALITSVAGVNTLVLAFHGQIVTVADALLPAGVPNDTANSEPNSRFLYWDKSAVKYQFTRPLDSVYDLEVIYYLKPGTVASTSLVLSLLPARPHTGLET